MAGPSHRITVHPMLRGVAPDFLTLTQRRVAEMRDALAADDLARVAWLAHQLAGSGLSFGVPYVSETGRTLEQAARNGERDGLAPLLQALDAYVARIEFV